MGCMEGLLSVCVGWDNRRMAMLMMERGGVALMSY
jgi:hypothetical protein